jgi:predicted deacylase
LASPKEPTPSERIAAALERTLPLLQTFVDDFHRLAEQLAPAPSQVVGTKYVAQRLDMTTVWVAEMARKGIIPKSCIIAGTGTGKLWKFDRTKIDRWIEEGRPDRHTA